MRQVRWRRPGLMLSLMLLAIKGVWAQLPERTAPAAAERPVFPSPVNRGTAVPGMPPPPRTPGLSQAPAASPSPFPSAPPALSVPLSDDAEPLEVLFLDDDLVLAQQRQAQVAADGLRLLRRVVLSGVGGVLSTYLAPDAASWRRWSAPGAAGTPNHRYDPLSAGDTPAAQARALVAWPPAGSCNMAPRIGLIDTPVDTTHPLLLGARIETLNLLASGQPGAGSEHGTAVASVLVGQRDTPALLPRAQLLAVSAFLSRNARTYSTAELLMRAIDRLVVARVAVINLSLGGPHNRWLEQVTRQAHRLGVPLVASAGNGGPDAPPVFPAAYAPVLAVLAVDLLGRPDPQAPQGAHLDFAAPGVDIAVAGSGGGVVYRSGSSLAAPFVAALVATGVPETQLRAHARDLGALGRDNTFGWGLVQAGACGPVPER